MFFFWFGVEYGEFKTAAMKIQFEVGEMDMAKPIHLEWSN